MVALVAHSFFDGIGIGLAFHVSPEVGWTVACAVIAHDFCDGLNTVSLMLARRHAPARTLAMLALDAIAPVLGAASTYAFSVPAGALAIALGFFAGSLLYVGAVDLLPQARSRAGSTAASLVGLTALGITFAYAVVRAAG